MLITLYFFNITKLIYVLPHDISVPYVLPTHVTIGLGLSRSTMWGFCTCSVTRHKLNAPQITLYLNGNTQSNQYRSSCGTNSFFFFLQTSNYHPSGNFIISDITRNKVCITFGMWICGSSYQSVWVAYFTCTEEGRRREELSGRRLPAPWGMNKSMVSQSPVFISPKFHSKYTACPHWTESERGPTGPPPFHEYLNDWHLLCPGMGPHLFIQHFFFHFTDWRGRFKTSQISWLALH